VRPTSKLNDPLRGAVDQLRLTPVALYSANFTPAPGANLQPGSPASDTRSVLVVWTPPTTGGATVAYQVYRTTDGAPRESIHAGNISGTVFVDETAPRGELCYEVEALNARGEAGPPATACLNTPAPAPNDPPALTAPLDLVVTRTDSLVAHGATGNAVYALDESTGQSAADATGQTPAATLGSATGTDSSDPRWLAGRVGNGLYFDGSNDRVNLGDAATLRLGGSFTLEAWVKRASSGTTDCIINKGDTGKRNYYLMLTANGKIELQWQNTLGAVFTTTTTRDSVIDSGWHHVAAVYDQNAGENRIYLDGVLCTRAAATGTPVTNIELAYLGVRRVGGSFTGYMHGTLDLVRLAGWAVYAANFTPPTSYTSVEPATLHRVTWTAPVSGGASGYNIYRAVAGGDFTRLNATPIPGLGFVDMTPPDGACYRVTAVDAAGTEGPACDPVCAPLPVAKSQAEPQDVPATPEVADLGAAPNPFNPSTVLRFSLAQAGPVNLTIYDVRGQRVATLQNGPLPAGEHTIRWEGRDESGATVASGVYFVALQNAGNVQRLKLLLLK
jgi:hypothetical protein